MSQENFVNSIISNLKANGFPEKRVSLPLEKMYEVAESKQLSFNDSLELLKAQGIEHTKTEDKIIFSKKAENPFANMDPSSFADINKDNIQEKAQNMMKDMSPEQLAEIQKMYMNMSPEEREKLMNQAKNMGLV